MNWVCYYAARLAACPCSRNLARKLSVLHVFLWTWQEFSWKLTYATFPFRFCPISSISYIVQIYMYRLVDFGEQEVWLCLRDQLPTWVNTQHCHYHTITSITNSWTHTKWYQTQSNFQSSHGTCWTRTSNKKYICCCRAEVNRIHVKCMIQEAKLALLPPHTYVIQQQSRKT